MPTSAYEQYINQVELPDRDELEEMGWDSVEGDLELPNFEQLHAGKRRFRELVIQPMIDQNPKARAAYDAVRIDLQDQYQQEMAQYEQEEGDDDDEGLGWTPEEAAGDMLAEMYQHWLRMLQQGFEVPSFDCLLGQLASKGCDGESEVRLRLASLRQERVEANAQRRLAGMANQHLAVVH